jgi:hypothetical protein
MKKIVLAMSLAGISLAGFAYWMFSRKHPQAPSTPLLSACRKLMPGRRRIGNPYGIQFDVAANEVTINEGIQDVAPFVHGFRLLPIHSNSVLSISFGAPEWPGSESTESDRASVISEGIEKRDILDSRRQVVGEDQWGHLHSGERWRRIRLRGSVYAHYGFASESDSAVFDRIMSSACLVAE